MRARGSALAAVLAGLLVMGGTPIAGLAAFSYDFSLGARVMYTDNLHLDPEPQADDQREPVQETVYAAIPALRLEWSEGSDRLLLDSRGEYWTFTGDEDLDPEWLPALTAGLGWRRWSPFFLEAGAERGRVPGTQDREGETIVDQSDRTFLTVRSGLAWERGANRTVEFGYRGELEYFSRGGAGEDDRVESHFGEALVRHQWAPLWWTEVSARYGLVEQDLAADYTELGVVGSIDYRLSERLAARGRLEWLREDYDAVADPDGGDGTPASARTSFLKGAEIRRTLERDGFWSLSYEDRLEAQPDGDTLQIGRASAAGLLRLRVGSEIGWQLWHEKREFRVSGRDETDWGPTVFARWLIAPWVALDLGGSYTAAAIREPDEEEIEDRTIRAAAAFVAALGRHLVGEAGYSYRENDSSDDLRSYTANLVYAGLTYHFRVLPPGELPASEAGRLASSDEGLLGGR